MIKGKSIISEMSQHRNKSLHYIQFETEKRHNIVFY